MLPTPPQIKSVLLLLGIAATAYYLFKGKQTLDNAVDFVSTDLNPASEENFIYQGTQDIGEYIGKNLYEVTH